MLNTLVYVDRRSKSQIPPETSGGWTQEEFATKLGIKRSLLGAYEEERAEPRLEVLETISDMFKLTLDELLRKRARYR